MHHFTTYETGTTNVDDAETSVVTETFPVHAIIPTCFGFHCVLLAIVLYIQPGSLMNSLTKSREGQGERWLRSLQFPRSLSKQEEFCSFGTWFPWG